MLLSGFLLKMGKYVKFLSTANSVSQPSLPRATGRLEAADGGGQMSVYLQEEDPFETPPLGSWTGTANHRGLSCRAGGSREAGTSEREEVPWELERKS